MVAGSFASSLHGLARTTMDIDLVVDPTSQALDHFVRGLEPERFYVDRAWADRALAERDQFNVVDLHTGWKVDLIVRKDRPFSATSEFGRRTGIEIFGVATFVATAEDTVLAKLEWASLGGSHRQVRDVIEIPRRRGRLDGGYLDRWASDLGVSDGSPPPEGRRETPEERVRRALGPAFGGFGASFAAGAPWPR